MTDDRSVMTAPTTEGIRRYPHTGGFYPDIGREGAHADHELPCTCEATCEVRCTGACGCAACEVAFLVYCDVAGFLGPGDSLDVEAATRAYQYVPKGE